MNRLDCSRLVWRALRRFLWVVEIQNEDKPTPLAAIATLYLKWWAVPLVPWLKRRARAVFADADFPAQVEWRFSTRRRIIGVLDRQLRPALEGEFARSYYGLKYGFQTPNPCVCGHVLDAHDFMNMHGAVRCVPSCGCDVFEVDQCTRCGSDTHLETKPCPVKDLVAHYGGGANDRPQPKIDIVIRN